MSTDKDVNFLKFGKKDQERAIIDGFLDRLQYKGIVKESERPDFVVFLEELRIGVEVTKYFTDVSKKGSHGERKVSKWVRDLNADVFTRPKSDWPTPPFQSGTPGFDDGHLVEIVRHKEKKASNYSSDFDQKWLIVFAHGVGLHDMYVDSFINRKNRKEITKAQRKSKGLPQSPGVYESEVQAKYFSHVFIWDKFFESSI